MDLTPEMIGILILEEIKGMRTDFKNIVSEVQSLRSELVDKLKPSGAVKKNTHKKRGRKPNKCTDVALPTQSTENYLVKMEANEGVQKFPSTISANAENSNISMDEDERKEGSATEDFIVENETEEIITTEHYYDNSIEEHDGESFILPITANNIENRAITGIATTISNYQSLDNGSSTSQCIMDPNQRKAPHRKARNAKFHSFTPYEYDLEEYSPKSAKKPRPKSGKHNCDICGKSLQDSSSLRIHMRIHTGEKPYKCSTCGKCFNRKSSLDLHNTIHTGIRPHNCQVCGKAFLRRDRLRQHMIAHNTGISNN